MLFWRSAYIVSRPCTARNISTDQQSTLYSVRNRTLVLADWLKVKLFGRSVLIYIIVVFQLIVQ